jgi:hypothetical protein
MFGCEGCIAAKGYQVCPGRPGFTKVRLISRLSMPFKKPSEYILFSLRFFKMMNDDELRAWYGEEHVFLAAERGAIGTLLISDRLFK